MAPSFRVLIASVGALTKETFGRRERPQVLVVGGGPAFLFNGVLPQKILIRIPQNRPEVRFCAEPGVACTLCDAKVGRWGHPPNFV